ncbi:ABC transporter permease [Nibricoccus sp. IMCC34717]|uniref:ABC transporter permease n=1 Tax=Nibricoccus sp. IMCC34717 TaxID=3034021 RepID=UPI0038510720
MSATSPTPTPEAAPRRAPRLQWLHRVPREGGLLVLLGVIVGALSVMYPYSFADNFWTLSNLSAVLRNLTFEGTLAIGMMVMMVGGTFDLSVGAMASLAGVAAGWLMKNAGVPVPLAVAGALALAAVGGALNGVLVARFRVNALITTLGTMGVFQGFALLIGGPGITFLPDSFSAFGQWQPLPIAGITAPIWLLALLAGAAHFSLRHTRFFRQYYYIGSNPRAATLSGIRVERLQIVAFTLMAMVAAIAGITYASRIATATATVGVGAELQAITAVILGGASLSGGKGTIFGALAGVLFVAVMKNALILLRVSSEWQGIVLGAFLVAAVALDAAVYQPKNR